MNSNKYSIGNQLTSSPSQAQHNRILTDYSESKCTLPTFGVKKRKQNELYFEVQY